MNNLKRLPLAFYILICYTCFSGYFAFERILNTDNSYFFFNILNTQKFWFAENRIGVFPSQIPLVLLVNLNAPLNVLIYTYSLSFPVIYLTIALFCQYYLKVKEAALTMALVPIIGVAYSFFHPVTETYHALAFAILLYAVLVSDRLQSQKTIYYLFIFASAFMSIVSHPIGVFVIGFVALFTLANKQINLTPFIFILSLGALSALYRLVFVAANSYDVKQYDTLFANFSDLSVWSNAYPLHFLKTRMHNLYLSTVILIITFITIAVKTKKTRLLFLSLTCAIGFALMGILTFLKGDADMMMEKTFLPSIFMLLLPFCYLFFTDTPLSRTSLHIIVLIMCILSFNQIYRASKIASERLRTLEAIASTATHPKLIAEIDNFHQPSLHFNHWNTPVDSYIISKCKTSKTFTLFLTADKHSFQFDSTDTNMFLGPPWAPYWNKTMVNQTYFELPQTGYRLYENNETK